MARFPPEIAAQLLAHSKRHCCVCLRWAGQRMQIHHIVPEAEGGSGEYSNGIPVCLDCHAEIESKSNMGRSFSPEELKLHRNQWFTTVDRHPEVLIRASQTQTETGPLEAVYAELDFNRIAISGPLDEAFPPLAVKQCERAIATNALSALDEATRVSIQRTYTLIGVINYQFEELARVDRVGGHGGAWNATSHQQQEHRRQLVDLISHTMHRLAQALGRED